MNNIDKIVQILEESSDDIRTDGHHEYSVIYSEKYEGIAETIVKNLTIPVVIVPKGTLPIICKNYKDGKCTQCDLNEHGECEG